MGFHVVYTSFVRLSSARARYFSFPKRPDQLWEPHSSCSMSARVLYRRQCGRRVNLTTQLRLAPWLKMSGTTPLLSLHAFIVWTWTTLRKTDHYIFPLGSGTPGCFYVWVRMRQREGGGLTGLLLVWAAHLSNSSRRLKTSSISPTYIERAHWKNSFRIGSSNSSFTTKSSACAFVAEIISWSVYSDCTF